MPQSKKDLKKSQHKKDAAEGFDRTQKKDAKPTATCTICKVTIVTTKKNIEIKQHAEAKHPKNSFQECFPGETHE